MRTELFPHNGTTYTLEAFTLDNGWNALARLEGRVAVGPLRLTIEQAADYGGNDAAITVLFNELKARIRAGRFNA
jgi:hypothetical protein